MDAVVKITKTPQQRRFRINPTYQFSVLVIPQEENQCTQISKPNITSPSKKPLNSDLQSTFDEVSCLLNDNLNAIERISFRAVCFVDETVLIGLQYDGIGSNLMYDISEKMDETLLNIPQMFDWGDQYYVSIENGLENIWKAKQKSKENQNEQVEEKEKIIIAKTQTFIFTEQVSNETINGSNLILDTILRVRHAEYIKKIQLSEFPFESLSDKDHQYNNIASIYTIVDTAEGVSLLLLNLDFNNRSMKLGSFAVVGLPNTSSRIIALHNTSIHDSNQLAEEILNQTLKETEQVDVELIDNKNQSKQFIHKLLLGGGKDILTIQDGQIQQQHYETKCINDIIIIQPKKNKSKFDSQNTSSENLNTNADKQKNKQDKQNLLSDKKKRKIKQFKHTTAVVTTSSGFPIIMQLNTGSIKEVDDDDDFCLPTGNIQQVINIPPKWQNQYIIQEDRMAFGVAHGITGSGALQLVQVGHNVKEIVKDDWIADNAKLFSSQQYSGKGIREFLLAQQENEIQAQIAEIDQSPNIVSNQFKENLYYKTLPIE
ncbi:MAG: hypothetical protein EZS28_017750 [Streblomastix strix]|uniref:Uncharacterized protein n=1 Tax=Streblomastix strix TaxID=222440 RepID=A0A5J4VVK8_9EUKA|nr:MAG: hypothetical protein EZS28_017750 [Streblomastix strix]